MKDLSKRPGKSPSPESSHNQRRRNRGRVLDLGGTSNLPRLILGTILETLDHEAIVMKNLNAVQCMVKQDSNASNETIAKELHVKLRAENVKMITLGVEHIVPQDSKAANNAQAWFEAETLEEGRVKIQDVGPVVDESGQRLMLFAIIRSRPAYLSVASSQRLLSRHRQSRQKILVFSR